MNERCRMEPESLDNLNPCLCYRKAIKFLPLSGLEPCQNTNIDGSLKAAS